MASRMVSHPWARTCTVNLPNTFEVSISTYYKDMKSNIIWKNGAVWSSQGSLKVTGNSTIRQSTYDYDFVLAFHSIMSLPCIISETMVENS